MGSAQVLLRESVALLPPIAELIRAEKKQSAVRRAASLRTSRTQRTSLTRRGVPRANSPSCVFAAQLRRFGDALLHMSAPLQALPALLHKALVHDPPQSLSDGESTLTCRVP